MSTKPPVAPLTDAEIEAICEKAWSDAETETANRLEAAETEWTRYGVYIAKAVIARLSEARPAPDPKLRAAFGDGPFHVEYRTNACSEVCDPQGRAVATFSWSLDAGKRADAFYTALALSGHST